MAAPPSNSDQSRTNPTGKRPGVSFENNSKNSRPSSPKRVKNILQPPTIGSIEPIRLYFCSVQDKPGVVPKILGYQMGHTPNAFSSSIVFSFISPSTLYDNRRRECLAMIWIILIEHWMTRAQPNFHGTGTLATMKLLPNWGLQLHVPGSSFEDLSVHVAKKVVSEVFPSEIAEEEFMLAKRYVAESLKHKMNDTNHILSSLTRTLITGTPLKLDYKESLELTRLEHLLEFIERFKGSCCSIIHLYGSLKNKEFQEIAEHLDNIPFRPPQLPNLWIFQDKADWDPMFYTPGETCLRCKVMTNSNNVTSVTNLYCLGPPRNQRDKECFDIAMKLIDFEASQNIKTVHQDGFEVATMCYPVEDMLIPLMMFSITVNAPAAFNTVCQLDQRIDQFMAEYNYLIRTMEDEVYEGSINLEGNSPTITKEEVADWVKLKFPPGFGTREIAKKCRILRIKKVSIQILSGNADSVTASCKNCKICENVDNDTGFVKAHGGSDLSFAKGNENTQGDYFVSNIKV